MTTEDKFAIALGVFCVLLLAVGTLVAKVLSTAPPKVMRTMWPVAAALTGAMFAAFVYVARYNVKG
ncbi:MAG TPA: hypothetical protein VHW74_00035 [Mycobacteriales bacterium]|nr:hypothetical protein [Mycobacteriales bacterium]